MAALGGAFASVIKPVTWNAARPKLPGYAYEYTPIEYNPDKRSAANLDAFEWYTASDGSKGHIATWNVQDAEVSCTFYTLRKLRDRGVGFPFESAGNANGGQWFDNSTGVIKERGWESLETMLQRYGGAEGKISNVVVSFDSNSSTSAELRACGHVMLIDNVYRNSNGELMVSFSDNYDWVNGRPLNDPYGNSEDNIWTFERFKETYGHYNGNMVGSVYIGTYGEKK